MALPHYSCINNIMHASSIKGGKNAISISIRRIIGNLHYLVIAGIKVTLESHQVQVSGKVSYSEILLGEVVIDELVEIDVVFIVVDERRVILEKEEGITHASRGNSGERGLASLYHRKTSTGGTRVGRGKSHSAQEGVSKCIVLIYPLRLSHL